MIEFEFSLKRTFECDLCGKRKTSSIDAGYGFLTDEQMKRPETIDWSTVDSSMKDFKEHHVTIDGKVKTICDTCYQKMLDIFLEETDNE